MAFVEYDVVDKIAYLTLSRPEKHNALTNAGIEEFNAAMRRFDADDSAHVAILSGRGPSFCSGADVKERLLPSTNMDPAAGPLPSVERVFETALNWKPAIAAVKGYALGKGMSLALNCDLVVASEDAQFQLTEITLGVAVPGYWSLLVRRGNDKFAAEVGLTGRYWSADEAKANGLINAVVPRGEEVTAAEELARQILRNPQSAVRATVALRRRTLRDDVTTAANMSIGHRWDLSEDYKESVAAKLENRAPVFTGR